MAFWPSFLPQPDQLDKIAIAPPGVPTINDIDEEMRRRRMGTDIPDPNKGGEEYQNFLRQHPESYSPGGKAIRGGIENAQSQADEQQAATQFHQRSGPMRPLQNAWQQGGLDIVGGIASTPGMITGSENAPGMELARSAASEARKIDTGAAAGGEGWVERQVRGIGRSAVQMAGYAGIARVIPGVNTQVGTILGPALSQASSAYEEAKASGMPHNEALAHGRMQGAIEGGVTALFNVAGVPGAEKAFADAIGKDLMGIASHASLKGIAKQAGKTFLEELPEELTISYLQQLDSKLAGVDPKAMDPDQLGSVILDTIVQTAGMSGIPYIPKATIRAVKDFNMRRNNRQLVAQDQQPLEATQGQIIEGNQPAPGQPSPPPVEPPNAQTPSVSVPQAPPEAAPQATPPPEPTAPTPEPVKPTKLTAETKRALRDKLSLNNAQMKGLSEEDAQGLLAQGPTPVEQPEVQHEPPPGEIPSRASTGPMGSPGPVVETVLSPEDMQRFGVGREFHKDESRMPDRPVYAAQMVAHPGALALSEQAGHQHVNSFVDEQGFHSLMQVPYGAKYTHSTAIGTLATTTTPGHRSMGAGAKTADQIAGTEPAALPEIIPAKGHEHIVIPEAMRADVARAQELGILDEIKSRIGKTHKRHGYKYGPYSIAMDINSKVPEISHSELSRIAMAVSGETGEWLRQQAVVAHEQAKKPKPVGPQRKKPPAVSKSPDVTVRPAVSATVAVEQKPDEKPAPEPEPERPHGNFQPLIDEAVSQEVPEEHHEWLKRDFEEAVREEMRTYDDPVAERLQDIRAAYPHWALLLRGEGDHASLKAFDKAARSLFEGEGPGGMPPVAKPMTNESPSDALSRLIQSGYGANRPRNKSLAGQVKELARDPAFVKKVVDKFVHDMTSFDPAKFDEEAHAGGSFYKAKKGQSIPTVKTAAAGTNAEPISAHDIRMTIDHDFGIPIMRGRVPEHAQAYHSWLNGTVRLSSPQWANLGIITHELGHGLDGKTDILSSAPSNVQSELSSLDYEPNRGDTKEGFAEFLRHYFTEKDAPTFAPQTYLWVENWLQDHPDYAKKFTKTTGMIDRFMAQNPRDAILAIQMGRGPKVLDQGNTEAFREQMDSLWQASKNAFYDDTDVAKQIVREASDRNFQPGVSHEFNILLDQLAGTDRARAYSGWFNGIHTISGDPQKLSESVPEIMKDIKRDELQDWESYAKAKDALSRIERMPGHNPGLEEAVYENRVKEIEADPSKFKRYDDAARGMRQFAKALLYLSAHEGVISHAAADRMADSQKDYYVPTYRIRDVGLWGKVKTAFGGGGKGFLAAKSPFKRMSKTGSPDASMPVMEAYMRQNNEAHNAAVKYAMLMPFVKAVIPRFGGAEGMGHFVAEVDPKTVLDRVKMEKILDGLAEEMVVGSEVRAPLISEEQAQLIKDVSRLRDGQRGIITERLAKRYGTDVIADLLEATKSVHDLDDAIAFYRKDFGSDEKEHIIRLIIDEKPVLLQFRQAYVWQALNGMRNPKQATTFSKFFPTIINGWNTVFTKTTKALTVALNPATVVSLAATDAVMFPLRSKKTGYLERYVAPLEGVGWMIGAKLRLMRTAGLKFSKEFAMSGAILAGLQEEEGGQQASHRFGSPAHSSKAMIEQTFARTAQEKLYATVRYDIANEVKEVNGILDSGMRLPELAGAVRQHGYKPNGKATQADLDAGKNRWIEIKSGKLVDDLPANVKADAMAAQNEVLVNFKRKGYAGRDIDKVVPFFSAAIAGSVNEGVNIVEILSGQGEAWGQRATAAAVLATASAMYALSNGDDDDREDMDPNIANRYWTFSAGGIPWLKIPKPRGYSFIPNLVEAAFDMARGRSPHFGEKLWAELGTVAPPWKPSGITPVVEVAINRDWAYRKIEDEGQEHLYTYLRSKPYTLESSKFMSKYITQWLGMSPTKTEYLADQYTGGQYTGIGGFIQNAANDKLSLQNSPLSRFQTRSLYQRSIGEFYDQFNATQQTVASDKFLNADRTSADESRLTQLTRYKKVLTELRKSTANSVSTDEKLKIDVYAVGLADYVLGKEPRESYPNPLAKSDKKVPHVVAEARDTYLASLGNELLAKSTTSPQTLLGEYEKLVKTKQVKPRNQMPPQEFIKVMADLAMEHVVEVQAKQTWARGELERLGYTQLDALKARWLRRHHLNSQDLPSVEQLLAR